MWANNGDVISRQYAGTNALKGDFTRTGERNLSGMMKDGVNSASRYYLNQFRDAFRQATIDLVTGKIFNQFSFLHLRISFSKTDFESSGKLNSIHTKLPYLN